MYGLVPGWLVLGPHISQWERTVMLMGISVHTAETEMATRTTPYYSVPVGSAVYQPWYKANNKQCVVSVSIRHQSVDRPTEDSVRVLRI